MATDLKLSGEYDLELDSDLHWVSDRDEVLQSCTIRLLFIQGESDFNFTLGIPWLTDMFDVQYPNIRKESNIKRTILTTLNVRRLTNFVFNLDPINKGAYVSFTAETVFGPISQEITV